MLCNHVLSSLGVVSWIIWTDLPTQNELYHPEPFLTPETVRSLNWAKQSNWQEYGMLQQLWPVSSSHSCQTTGLWWGWRWQSQPCRRRWGWGGELHSHTLSPLCHYSGSEDDLVIVVSCLARAVTCFILIASLATFGAWLGRSSNGDNLRHPMGTYLGPLWLGRTFQTGIKSISRTLSLFWCYFWSKLSHFLYS